MRLLEALDGYNNSCNINKLEYKCRIFTIAKNGWNCCNINKLEYKLKKVYSS